jgi:ABC-type hemin transport system substrate-binding protein
MNDVPGTNGQTSILSFSSRPKRVVSLVPSLTGSLFDMGLGDSLVAVTRYCSPPPDAAGRLEVIGGTRDPDLDHILSLHPDLVMANKEENDRRSVEALEAAGIAVWVTFPCSVAEALEVLWALAGLFRAPVAAQQISSLALSLEWTARASESRAPFRYFCPIWQARSRTYGLWWMTFNQQTYAHDVLKMFGGQNVFAERQRQFPLAADLGRRSPINQPGRDRRYPRVTAEEVISARPEVILLPSEPHVFSGRDEAHIRQTLADTPAVKSGRLIRLDGSLITWHGTRLARALVELPALLDGFPS